MSDAISRVNDARSRNLSSDDELTCHEEPLMSASTSIAERSPSSSSGDGAPVSPRDAGVSGPHAEAHAENGDLYAGAFALRGSQGGIDVEVFSVSAHSSEREAAAQAAMARMGGAFDIRVEAQMEVFTAQSHSTLKNPDGSTGFGASAGTTLVGGEITLSTRGFSVTGALSMGPTVGASLGVRDSDRDGDPELCGRVDFAVGAFGLCLEKVW
jgi:hypothetical protein